MKAICFSLNFRKTVLIKRTQDEPVWQFRGPFCRVQLFDGIKQNRTVLYIQSRFFHSNLIDDVGWIELQMAEKSQKANTHLKCIPNNQGGCFQIPNLSRTKINSIPAEHKYNISQLRPQWVYSTIWPYHTSEEYRFDHSLSHPNVAYFEYSS